MERGINRAKTVLYVMADRLGDLGEMDELMKVIGMNRAWTETDKQGKRRRKSRHKNRKESRFPAPFSKNAAAVSFCIWITVNS